MAAARLLDLVREHRDEVQAAVERHRGLSFAVFGSAARGDDSDARDIDFLVRFAPGSSLFDLLHLGDELEGILGRIATRDVPALAGSILIARPDLRL